MGSADAYTCTLTEASLKKACEELNENPADRLCAVEAFRKLIKTQAPHLKCSMGKYVCASVCMSICLNFSMCMGLIGSRIVRGGGGARNMKPAWIRS